MKVKVVILVSLIFSCFVFSEVLADTGTYVPVSGFDATGDSPSAMTTSSNGDIFKFSASDDKRMATNSAWPGTGAYDENKYIELDFSPGVPDNAQISSVTVTNEYRRNTILTAAKLEIWDGATWNDVPLSLPDATGTDLSETKDISSLITTAAALNSLKIRFLAYRDTVATSATTSHDYLAVSATYSSATPTPTDTPVATDTPAATETPTPTPITTDNPASTATATPSAQNSFGLSSTPIPSATPKPTASKTPSPTPVKPSATPTPSSTPSVTPTPVSLNAEISSAFPTPSLDLYKRHYYVKKMPTPTPTPQPTPTPRMSVVQLITPPIVPIAFRHLSSFLHRIF